jgi:hypothetical protein
MEIDIETLAACEVAADGGAISLGFVDSVGRPATVTLSLNDAGSLAMTLPGLITKALQTRFGDRSLHNAAQVLVTLRTADGFSACFSVERRQQNQFGEALLAEPAATTKEESFSRG